MEIFHLIFTPILALFWSPPNGIGKYGFLAAGWMFYSDHQLDESDETD